MIQSSAGPEGTSEEPADGESSARPGAVTRAFTMWDRALMSRGSAIALFPAPPMTQSQRHHLQEACPILLRLSVTPPCSKMITHLLICLLRWPDCPAGKGLSVHFPPPAPITQHVSKKHSLS